MQVNLGNEDLSVEGIAQVFPHELNHQIYEISSAEDENYGTVLWGIIDEGFATYFEKTYNNNDVLSSLNFDEQEYQWCLANELRIFEKAKPLFSSTDGDDEQRLSGNQGKYLIEGAPARLNYFIGYRIVERYVQIHGESSWKDIYTTDVEKVLEESKYEEHISSLK